MSLITPRTLRGFRDYLPEVMMPRERCMEIAREVFRSFGFAPIDTPALEYLEVLTGKGSDETDRQLYQFVDQGDRHVGMRFDLTVPFARFAAQHINELGTPFKRYHIAPVWRGEKSQAGRYREFIQCDFDTIGTQSVAADIETPLVIHSLMLALGFEAFKIHINDRRVLTGLLEHLGIAEHSVLVLRALDKLAKIGADKVAQEMQDTAGVSESQARAVLGLAEIDVDANDLYAQLSTITGENATAALGIERLQQMREGLAAAGVPASRVKLDLTIARGLDYYTGVIFETFLDALPSIGSVCSGGRYDNLAELFTKQHLPGVGASLGLDRLLAAMEQLEMLPQVRTPAPVFIPYFDKGQLNAYLQLAATVRAAGIGVEVFPEPKKLGQQLKYADGRGFTLALIAGTQEFDAGTCQIKDLRDKSTTEVEWSADQPEPLLDAIRSKLKS
ncbi:Histidine--tRNA ligase [Rosistilla ulvae]|uniref:Histidine--tRNA ligase n=1 Tax=Rosistilla ulvae TaxID=1930277 RepID=A0A517M8E0_9BACT|nr:histidine--tRNA ligase [Rosistilla ulvae]QDS91143.1 Histidine--tRNA ligase [Rosistilla ulvae]